MVSGIHCAHMCLLVLGLHFLKWKMWIITIDYLLRFQRTNQQIAVGNRLRQGLRYLPCMPLTPAQPSALLSFLSTARCSTGSLSTSRETWGIMNTTTSSNLTSGPCIESEKLLHLLLSIQEPSWCAGPQGWWYCFLMAWTALNVACSMWKGGSCCWHCLTLPWIPSSIPTRMKTCTAPWRRWFAVSLRRPIRRGAPPVCHPQSSAGVTQAANI